VLLLTGEMVELNTLSRHWGWTDYDVLRPGAELARQGRVSVIAFTGEAAACQVHDNQSVYTVTVETQRDGQVAFCCECRRARQGRHCLHMAAAAQALGDYVVHLDPWWNPAVEQQANERPHRIGQDGPVIIYRLITRDSVGKKDTAAPGGQTAVGASTDQQRGRPLHVAHHGGRAVAVQLAGRRRPAPGVGVKRGGAAYSTSPQRGLAHSAPGHQAPPVSSAERSPGRGAPCVPRPTR
jgi:hypothetical protein